MSETKVREEATSAHLLEKLVSRIGRQPWTKAGAELYNTLYKAQKLEKEDREAREAAAKAQEEAAKAEAANPKPLPCPWCGTQVESFTELSSWAGPDGYQDACRNCGAKGSTAGTKTEAHTAWNTRNGKPQDRRQGGERRVATVAEAKAQEAAAKAKEAAEAKPLPCPWCGTQTESFDKPLYALLSVTMLQYRCNKCHAEGPVAKTDAEARLAWNTRAWKSQDRRQNGERRVATEAERIRYDHEAPWNLLRRERQRRAADRLA